MLQRFVLPTAANEFAQGRELRFRKLALKLQINIQPPASQRVSKEMLRVKSWIFDSAFFEICSRGLKHIQHCHALLHLLGHPESHVRLVVLAQDRPHRRRVSHWSNSHT